jgi:hypothetical protein
MVNDPRDRLRELLVYLHEDLDVELKDWLDLSSEEDKADLAKAILAIANHGGGFVVLGVKEGPEGWVASRDRPAGRRYTQDLINGIVKSYADPPFHCELHLLTHPDWRARVPIVVVPGGHKVPIRARRDGPNRRHVHADTYYIRGGGPESRAIRSSEEWSSLLARCLMAARDRLLESFRLILEGGSAIAAPTHPTKRIGLTDWMDGSRERFDSLIQEKLPTEKPSRFSHGVWLFGYLIDGDVAPVSLSDLLQILREVKGHETGWPPWWVPTKQVITPYVFEETVECWLAEPGLSQDPSHSDFWRASPRGTMFLARGYEEDSRTPQVKPGTELEFTLPVWRVGECLLHAERLGRRLAGEESSVEVQILWTGLKGRILSNWRPARLSLEDTYRCSSESIATSGSVALRDISTTLPEIVLKFTRPLYEAFNFFKMPMATIQAELSYMRWRK